MTSGQEPKDLEGAVGSTEPGQPATVEVRPGREGQAPAPSEKLAREDGAVVSPERSVDVTLDRRDAEEYLAGRFLTPGYKRAERLLRAALGADDA